MMARTEPLQNLSFALMKPRATGCLIVDQTGHIRHKSGFALSDEIRVDELYANLPEVREHIERQQETGACYRVISDAWWLADAKIVYVSRLAHMPEYLVVFFAEGLGGYTDARHYHELFILSLITKAIRAFNQAEKLDDILRIILVAVTAGSGLGFNRAFIFLTDTAESPNCLIGRHATGPTSPEEAGIIWSKLSSGEITLESMFEEILHGKGDESTPLDPLIEGLRIPLTDNANMLTKVVLENRSMIIDEAMLQAPEYAELRRRLGGGPMAAVPFVGKESLQGMLFADNFITRKPITESDLNLLEVFARYASDSIEKFRLYESLAKKIDDLRRANETILLNRENLVKAERLSVLAQMAGEVAHEIRNPLTVIGGFTKSMLRRSGPQDENYEYLNIIVEQVTRIEHALEKFTSLMNYQQRNEVVCNFADIVRSSLELLSCNSSCCRLEDESGLPIKIKADPDLLRQAMMVLIRRAIEQLNGQGALVLRLYHEGNMAGIYFEAEPMTMHYGKALYRSVHLAPTAEARREMASVLEIIRYYGGDIDLQATGLAGMKFGVKVPLCQEE